MYDFSNVLGQEQIIKSFKLAISHNKVSHGYIFQGSFGAGKKLISNCLAKALQCKNNNVEPCGVCSSCLTVESHNNPDIFYVKPTKTKALGADDVREQIIKEVETRPYSNSYKIFIIENADKMSITAQNILLKTLEEPPSYVIIFLLAENIDLFLPTVLSRCVVMKFQPLSYNIIKEYLITKKNITESQSEFYSRYATGSIGKAVKLSEDENFIQMRDDIINKMFQINNTSLAEVINWGKELEKYKEDIFQVLEIAYLWFRDVLVSKKIKNSNYIIQKDKEKDIIAQGKSMSFKDIDRSLNAVWNAKRQLEQNGSFSLTLEIMFMNIKGV